MSVRSDADLDADILVVAKADHVTEQQLACAEKAANYYDVELTSSLQPRFEALREARMAAVMVSRARDWLRKHDLLDRLPDYRPGLTDDAAFARKIETLCDAQGALESADGPRLLNTQWAMQHMTPPDMKTGPMECLFNATAAAGFDVGFIGNRPNTP
ncbi:hypothetical protein SAMN05216557_10199 [Sphingomonas carotinifaciens]|uniref:Uncharacterized protein n=1 Tax=Sphingomonas carotinifaciens TaxID=1166323 RepID=A0A1G7ETV8_9SPHN|nr:hypothetical protein [Sphingomonas carotinifaciens]SDE67130.1 hypothetical protein SAMN05216557_10199 [Sphingomonas carotinifaciens]